MTSVTPVIMIGGSGTRLWPLSRRSKPKQFHALIGDGTLLQTTVERVSGWEGALRFEPPILIAGEAHEPLVREQLRSEQIGTLVLEPSARSTAPCAVVAAEIAGGFDPERLMLLLPSDHHMADVAAFRAAVAGAVPAAEAGGIVTFGVRPTAPATGYGYILCDREGLGPVRRFVEKPDLATAQAYLADGRYLWNAGIFLMRADVLIREMERHRPDVLAGARTALAHSVVADGVVRLDPEAFAACPADSLDYAVMEKTSLAVVMPLDAGWSDVGDFDALWAAMAKDTAGNAMTGAGQLREVSNSLIISDGPLVTAVGVDNLVVIVRDGAVLILPRHRAQEVGGVTEALRATEHVRHL